MSSFTTLDVEALKSYLPSKIEVSTGISVHHIEKGLSPYQVYEIILDGNQYILRTTHPSKPDEFAIGVEREYEMLCAIENTAAPSPKPIHYCDDISVIGRTFYLMEFVSGEIPAQKEPNWINSVSQRQFVGEEIIKTLGSIHSIPLEDLNLEQPEQIETVERFIDRWSGHVESAKQVTSRQREVNFETIRTWLKDNIPTDGQKKLLHGDYMLDNVVLNSEPSPQLEGVLDWEWSTVGDPRIDLGWFLLFWYDRTDPKSLASHSLPTFTQRDGYHSRDELVSIYLRCSEIMSFDIEYFRTLAAFKLASMSEYFYYLYLSGEFDREMYNFMGQLVPMLVDRIENTIQSDDSLVV